MSKRSFTAISGAAFLMATSAIGPGFINNTTKFTQQLGASFGFVILVSVLLDIMIQLNLWRIISVHGDYAQNIANRHFPGTGHVLILLVTAGGFVFNIGNIAGCALGLQVMSGMPLQSAAVISASIAVLLFVVKEAGKVMDWFTRIIGLLMILLTLYVCLASRPDMVLAVHKTFVPDTVDWKMILTIVGGTVGGYISFSGAHRLIDSGIRGKENITRVTKGAVSGIVIASLMRYVLFLAALGVVMGGTLLSEANPARTVFETAAGSYGLKLFGLVLWSAGITSVVGSAFTSVSFLQSLHPVVERRKNRVTIFFILASALTFLYYGQPSRILVFAGAFNGIVLPVSLCIMLLVSQRSRKEYRHPLWLTVCGWIAVSALAYMAVKAFVDVF
jgi:Mn2+/Fe2+ NRAMP family transporter